MTCLISIDDVIIFSSDERLYVKDNNQVLTLLVQAWVTLGLRKCLFSERKLISWATYVTDRRLSATSKKIDAIKSVVFSNDSTKKRSFLKVCKVDRKFMNKFLKIAQPLNNYQQKDRKFDRSHLAANALNTLNTLKCKLIEPTVLKCLPLHIPYMIYTDASAYALRAVVF